MLVLYVSSAGAEFVELDCPEPDELDPLEPLALEPELPPLKPLPLELLLCDPALDPEPLDPLPDAPLELPCDPLPLLPEPEDVPL